MDNKKSLHEKIPSQKRIEIIEKKYAKVRENQLMEILLKAAKEYLTEKGQEKNGS